MKEQYIRQVRKELHLPRRIRAEVVRDLGEIFASAAEHGESEAAVIERLGRPEEFAARTAKQFGVDNAAPRQRARLLSVLLAAMLAAAAFVVYAVLEAAKVPVDAIGQAEAQTNIQIAGTFGLDAAKLMLAAGIIAAGFAALQIIRAIRSRRVP